jgi:hypothetical protein
MPEFSESFRNGFSSRITCHAHSNAHFCIEDLALALNPTSHVAFCTTKKGDHDWPPVCGRSTTGIFGIISFVWDTKVRRYRARFVYYLLELLLYLSLIDIVFTLSVTLDLDCQ